MFEYNDYHVRHVMNITDVGHLTGDNIGDADLGEDRMERSARLQGKSAWQLAKFYTDSFFKDVERLNIRRPHVICKATDHIREQIALVQKLEQKGYTYRASDGIYFDTSKLAGYGKLAGQSRDDRLAGARVEVNPQKRHPADFALWRFSPQEGQRQMEWDSPWGVGFPGWHVECSAMSTKYLGQPFDIHCGGVDHIAIHHTNEIAQSEAAEGKTMANYWLHGEFMTVAGRRMGKSEGNAYLVDDLIDRGFDPLSFRYLCLNTHYRVKLNFTWEALEAAQNALERLREHVRSHKESGVTAREGEVLPDVRAPFYEAINDDLNVPAALGFVWELMRSDRSPEDRLATLEDFDRVLGLRLAEVKLTTTEVSKEVQQLLAQREMFRARRLWKDADKIRDELQRMGYAIEDTPQGPKVRKLTRSP